MARDNGTFVNADNRHPFSAGDVLFVPAGVPHRFEDFTDDDFDTWVSSTAPKAASGRAEHEKGTRRTRKEISA